MDGTQTPFKIERSVLRKIVKGPEALLTPTTVAEDDQRLFDVRDSKDDLRAKHFNGALDYIRRGETVVYKVSEDSLKGGIPAQRSNIKNRKPYWYSLGVPEVGSAERLVMPEHFDRRYIVSRIPDGNDSVVIDTCYWAPLHKQEDAEIILAALNSLLSWYQLELRGRTQHGEGVLKVKIPDWHGILVANPESLAEAERDKLRHAWVPLAGSDPGPALDQVVEADRVAFDTAYLEVIGVPNAEDIRLEVERELRAAIAERHTRTESVAEAKHDRTPVRRATASVDAYASRIAARHEPYPDPRSFVKDETPALAVPIAESASGAVTVGTDLFTFGNVFVGGTHVASAGDQEGAIFIRGVLLHDPDVRTVNLPMSPMLKQVLASWEEECVRWQGRFEVVAREIMTGMTDDRLRGQIRNRALTLLHAQ